jgi:hypothetical protein
MMILFILVVIDEVEVLEGAEAEQDQTSYWKRRPKHQIKVVCDQDGTQGEIL